MKLYVDELPKSCENCSIYKSYLGCCLTDFSRTTPRTERHNKCPLQSLADHTKQVRKDVCEDFKSRFLVTCQIEKGCDNATFSLGTLDRILDQIEGE